MIRFSAVDPEVAVSWLLVPGDWRRPHADGHFEILWDRSQAFGQLWPRPDAREVASFYELDAYYTHKSEKGSNAEAKSLSQRVQNKVSWSRDNGIEPDPDWWSTILGREKLRILEIGCGNGSNLSTFVSLGHEVVGVEPDPQALEVARSLGHIVFQGAAEALPAEVSADRFDAVVFMHVLEHCVDPLVAVQEARRLLNPGARFVAEVPNNECLGVIRFGELWPWLDVPRHLNFFTEASLRALVEDSGLRVDSVFFRGYCRQFSSGWKEVQEEIASSFSATGDKRISTISYWKYFLETAWSSDQRKYDSVRISASMP